MVSADNAIVGLASRLLIPEALPDGCDRPLTGACRTTSWSLVVRSSTEDGGVVRPGTGNVRVLALPTALNALAVIEVALPADLDLETEAENELVSCTGVLWGPKGAGLGVVKRPLGFSVSSCAREARISARCLLRWSLSSLTCFLILFWAVRAVGMLFARGTLSEEEDNVDDDEGDGKGTWVVSSDGR